MYLIAEIGQAHDGSLGQAHSYIDALSKSNISAIKFQIHIADAESSSYEDFRVKFSYEDKTRFDYWKRMEFTLEQWKGLKQHCEDVKLDFIASPFSCKAVDLLKSINNETYKIGSGEVNNKLMIEKIVKLKKKNDTIFRSEFNFRIKKELSNGFKLTNVMIFQFYNAQQIIQRNQKIGV